MKLHQRHDRLENQIISETTILFMPDSKDRRRTGPNDYLLTLLGVAREPERATPKQSQHLDQIQKCTGSSEPGGAHLVDLIRCLQQ